MLQPDAKVGDLRFIDTNGDGVINDNDRVLSRSYTPKQTYSFGGSLDWKGFDFSFMFQGVAGNYVYNGTKQLGMNGRQDLGNLTTDVYNTWDFKPMSIDNVATITGYSGTDPEVGNYGLDSGIYPTSRFFNFGVNINF